MRTIIIAALVSGSVGVAAAQADSLGRPCTSTPESKWLSVDVLKAKAEALGYQVKKAKVKDACGEIYVIDKSGARAELFVDPSTGDIVAKK